MPSQDQEYISDVWKDNLFGEKVVFCTGGAGTICSAQVRALVYLGANACIVGRNVEKTERVAKEIATVRTGARVLGIGGLDVRDSEGLKAAADRCVKELGGIDYAIAGAAGNFLASINNISSNAFKSVMDIDVLGSYNTVKATIPHLVKSAEKHRNDLASPRRKGTGGRIIFLSSTTHYIGSPFQTHVAAAKAGVDAMSNNVALEFGPHGVTSNVITPGPIENTEGVARLVPAGSEAAVRKGQPLGRYGLTKDIADATVYLLSESGSYVSGHTLVVDGASWRAPGGSLGMGNTLVYPDSLLSGNAVVGVKGRKEQKL